MKKTAFLAAVTIFLASCASTQITGAWKSPKATKTFSSVFVASLSSNNIVRATVENDIASELERQGIVSFKGIEEFPPGIKRDSLTKEEILGSMRNKKADAILTISLIRKETESRYLPGSSYRYDPLLRYPYYSDFWGYYSYWSPYAYSPGYYEENRIYYLETNLYDSATEQLIWSAQSRTYNPTNIKEFSREFSKVIVTKLKEDGMLKPSVNLSTTE
jgi:hypothetical protein